MPPLIDLYDRSIFKNLPTNLSRLFSSNHPKDLSTRPLVHKKEHSKQDKIVNVGTPGGRHIVGESTPLKHIEEHSKLDDIVNVGMPGGRHFPLPTVSDRSLIQNKITISNGFSFESQIKARSPIGISLTGRFNSDSGFFVLGDKNIDIYGKFSNRSGFLSQPFFETKLQGLPSGLNRVETGLRDMERIGKFTITSKGLLFAGKQLFLQSMNPTLETKVWNPLSLLNPNLGLGNIYTDRHFSTGIGSKILNGLLSLIPGVNNPLSTASTYGEAILNNKSRVINQVPHVDTNFGKSSDPRSGLSFANQGINILNKKFKDHNPNKYNWPVGSDGAGLPFSSRIGPFGDLARNKKLIQQGEKFTKSIGFNSRDNTPKSLLDSVISAIPGVAAISNIIAGIRGAINPSGNKVGIKFVNANNLSRPYSKANEIRTGGNTVLGTRGSTLTYKTDDVLTVGVPSPLGIVDRFGLGGDQTQMSLIGSPLTNILDKIAKIGETNRGGDTTKPAYTFLKKDELKAKLGIKGQLNAQKLPDVITGKTKSIENSKVNIDSYLQTYGEIGKKHESKKRGEIDLGRRQPRDLPPGRSLHYESFVQRSRQSTLNVNYGFAGKQSEYKSETIGLDRINALKVGETPENISPFLEELIPFRFFHINEKRWIVFRAYLTGITETNNANWNEKRYIGRADPVFTYTGATRKLNFNFDVHPESVRELAPLWKKINAVVALCWPTYIDIPKGGSTESLGQYMVGPFVRLTIGDMYNQVPGIVNSITVVADDTGTWEDRRGKVEKSEVAQLPKYIRITVDFTIIGHEIFDSKANFFDFEEGFNDRSQVSIVNSGIEILDQNQQPDPVNAEQTQTG